MPTELLSGYEVTDADGNIVPTGGIVQLDENRQAIQDQYPLQIVEGEDGAPTTAVVGMVPNVDQSFGGVFTADSCLVGNSDGSTVSGASNQLGTTLSPINPRLGPLQDNGGPVFNGGPPFTQAVVPSAARAGSLRNDTSWYVFQ